MKLTSLLFVGVFSAYGQVQPIIGQPAANNLPMQIIGANDLLAISVYDSPELTRSVRVSAAGTIRLPMLREKIQAAGRMPSDLEADIANALQSDEVLVEPLVTVTISEYHSRPISVMGAVRRPITFQAEAPVTLLDAIARAEGLTPEAGPVILVTRTQAPDDGGPARGAQRIPVTTLIDGASQEANLSLTDGE